MPKLTRFLTRAWVTVGLLAVVACLNYLDRVMLTTMRPSIVKAIPMSESQFGLLTSVFLWVYGGLSPFAGFVADRFSRSRVIVVSLFVWSLVTWLTGHATTFHQLLAVRAIMGISEACYIPAALSLITDFHRGPTRSLATGIHMVGISLGSALGGLGGVLADHHRWSFAFTLFGLIGLGYALILVLTLRDAPKTASVGSAIGTGSAKPAFLPALVSLFRERGFLYALVFWGLLGLQGWVFVGWIPTYLLEHFHLSQGTAGLSSTTFIMPMTCVGLLVGGAWADRWSRTNARGRIFVTAIGLCVAGPMVLLAILANHLWIAVGLLGITYFTTAFSNANMMPILCMVSEERYRATGYGVLNLFGCAVGGLAIYFGGALRDANIPVEVMFEIAAASMIVCAGLLMLIRADAGCDLTGAPPLSFRRAQVTTARHLTTPKALPDPTGMSAGLKIAPIWPMTEAMNVSSSTSSSGSAASGGQSSQVASLEKQIASAQKQITTENKSTDDSKTKQQVVQQLELLIMELQMQIQQIQQQQAMKAAQAQATTQATKTGAKGTAEDATTNAQSNLSRADQSWSVLNTSA